MQERTPILTVGDLKSELDRWDDETPVTFRSPLNAQDFRFYRFQGKPKETLVVELNEYPDTPTIVGPGA